MVNRRTIATSAPLPDRHAVSSSLNRLPGDLRDWAIAQGWTALRPIQVKAWERFAASDTASHDLIVCAPTATGKTEAVFLPLMSRMGDWEVNGFEILYVCPLKALIDQQTARLTPLFKVRDRRVTAWHGEATAGRAAAERSPEGLLIITPESLEGLLRRGRAPQMFAGLKAIVIDELHAFFGTPRGVQVIAQFSRLDHALGRSVPRIGLSATLSGDIEPVAKAFLRPSAPDRVVMLSDDTQITAINFEVRGYVDDRSGSGSGAKSRLLDDLRRSIAEPMVSEGARTTKALVFCNSRAMVEWCATELRTRPDPVDGIERIDLSSLVYPHHGSLERDARRRAEGALRDPERPALIVSSPTLELGLDVGEIEQVVQVDPGPSVASLRQRLGRSGRRAGKVARLTLMVREEQGGGDAHPLARLHVALAQGLAQLTLVDDQRFEAPPVGALNLSTFVQQTLSMAARTVDAETLDRVLVRDGPFEEAAAPDYRALVDRLAREKSSDLPGARPLLRVEPGGLPTTFGLTLDGEAIANGPSFGAAFDAGRQFSVRAGGEILGQIPGGHNLKPGDPVFFAGRRWAVQALLDRPPTVLLQPSGGGKPPRFAGSPIAPSGLVVEAMRALYSGSRPLPEIHLDRVAEGLWSEAREAYRALKLDTEACLAWDDDVLLFPWTGPRAQATLIAALRHCGVNAGPAHVAVMAPDQTVEAVRSALVRIASWDGLPSPEDLVRGVKTPRLEKFDGELGPYLQRRNFASTRLDVEGARAAAGMLTSQARTVGRHAPVRRRGARRPPSGR